MIVHWEKGKRVIVLRAEIEEEVEGRRRERGEMYKSVGMYKIVKPNVRARSCQHERKEAISVQGWLSLLEGTLVCLQVNGQRLNKEPGRRSFAN